MGNKRRLNPRAIVRLAAQLRKDRTAEWQEVLLYDLSAGGARIHTGIPLTAGSDVGLRFELPASEGERPVTIEVRALMVRAAAAAPPDPSRPYLYGLHFLDLQDEAFDRVARYVWDRVHSG